MLAISSNKEIIGIMSLTLNDLIGERRAAYIEELLAAQAEKIWASSSAKILHWLKKKACREF